MNHRSFSNPILLVCLLVTVMLSGLFFLNRDDASAELTIPTSLETNGDPDASGYTVNSQGDLAYVVLLDSNLVALVDTASHEVVGTINAGTSGCVGPERAKITPDGRQAYFPCNYSDSVLVVETTGNTVITNVTGIPSPNDAASTRDGAYALIGTVNGGIVVIDTMTYEIVDTISNPARIGSLAT